MNETPNGLKENAIQVIPPSGISKDEKVPIPVGNKGITPQTFEDLQRFAEAVVRSGLAPKGMNNIGAVIMAMQTGMEHGLSPMSALQTVVVVQQNISWKGTGAASLIMNNERCVKGTLRYWHEGEGEEAVGIAVAHRTNYKDPHRSEFTVRDAKRAGLWKKQGSWQQYPQRMLMWRALGMLARDAFPDVLGGFPIAEEAQDYEPTVPEKPSITSKPEGPMSTKPDPLMAALDVKAEPVEPTTEQAEVAAGMDVNDDIFFEEEIVYLCKHGIAKDKYCGKCSLSADSAVTDKEADGSPGEDSAMADKEAEWDSLMEEDK